MKDAARGLLLASSGIVLFSFDDLLVDLTQADGLAHRVGDPYPVHHVVVRRQLESPESKPAKPVLRTAAVMGNGQNLKAVRPWPVNDR